VRAATDEAALAVTDGAAADGAALAAGRRLGLNEQNPEGSRLGILGS